MSFDPDNYSELAVKETSIPGLYEIDLVVHGDDRGWFKENYQKAKLESLGLPKFEVVQNNISYNDQAGITRGLHAEPWEKFVSVANGSVFCAWVDLRKGSSFGQTLTSELSPGKAFLVPRGIANGYQTLETNTIYTYLVNDHWSTDVTYSAVNLFDPEIAVAWPFAREQAIISAKDLANPLLAAVVPMDF